MTCLVRYPEGKNARGDMRSTQFARDMCNLRRKTTKRGNKYFRPLWHLGETKARLLALKCPLIARQARREQRIIDGRWGDGR